MPGNVVCEMT